MFQNIEQALNFIQKAYGLSSAEALTYFHEHYNNMSIDAALAEIEMARKQHYLELHKKLGHKITHSDKDGRWRTNVYYNDGSYKTIALNSKLDLEDRIIRHYEEKMEVYSMERIFPDYCIDRQKYVKQTTIVRDRSIYNSFLAGTAISKKSIRKIKPKELEDFLNELLRKRKLTRKAFNGLKSLLNGLFTFAVVNEYTSRNVAREVRSFGRAFFDSRGRYDAREMRFEFQDPLTDDEDDDEMLRDEDYDESEDSYLQYFSAEEQAQLITTALRLYEHRENTAYLAIVMNFCLGLRIAELVALKPKDFDFEKNLVHIRRQEVVVYQNGHKDGVRISNRMKTIDSNRFIPISNVCREIFDLVMEYNRKNACESEYLFNSKTTGQRMRSKSVDNALDLANIEAGLPQRSNHKIRKTVLSRLNMSRNFTLEHIRELAGHSRQSFVLYTNYFYNIPGLEGISDCRTFGQVVDFKMPKIKESFLETFSESEMEMPKKPVVIRFFTPKEQCNSV